MNSRQTSSPIPPLTEAEEAFLHEIARADEAVRLCQQSPEHERIAGLIAARLRVEQKAPPQNGGWEDF